MSRSVRIAAALAIFVLCATFLAAQIDFSRRFQIGMSPTQYWIPQLRHIWLVGLIPATLLASAAFGTNSIPVFSACPYRHDYN
jgi:hypothetical protein